MRTALHSLSDSLGRRLLFMVKLYAANDCRNDTLGMAAGSLFWQTKNSARFWDLSGLQASR